MVLVGLSRAESHVLQSESPLPAWWGGAAGVGIQVSGAGGLDGGLVAGRVGREACTLELVGGGRLVRAQGGAGLGVQALAGLC